ncbi:MAG: hypothetical protein ACTMIR_04270 [Cellulomonadaceae bacterium]
MISADEFLSGPRGRRLCLVLACADEDVRLRVFYASHELDPNPGTMVTVGTGTPPPPPPHAPGDVARAIDAADVRVPDALALIRALDEVTANARYWQEPDGDDVLAATAPVRHVLDRVAHVVADAPAARWWGSPWEPDAQHEVRFTPEGTGDAPEVPVRTDEAQEAWGDPTAAVSGTWWSKPPWRRHSTTRSLGALGPVGLWCVEDGFGETDAMAVSVMAAEQARVYEIDGPGAWARLCREHPLDVTASRRHDWFRATGRDGRWVQPDWTDVARSYDGVHLTVAGYLATAGRAIEVDVHSASVLAGWSPDQTYWLAGSTRAAGPPVAWAYRDDGAGGERWEPRDRQVPGA